MTPERHETHWLARTVLLEERVDEVENKTFFQLMGPVEIVTGYDKQFNPVKSLIGEEEFKTMIKNFKKRTRGVDLAIDYSHRAYDKAAGWIKDLKTEDGNLWAEIDWTKEGKRSLEEKEYRYLSAEFSFDQKGNHVIFGGGLTNRPRIKSMEPLTQLSEEKKMDFEEQLKEMSKRLDAAEKETSTLKLANEKLSAEALEKEKHIEIQASLHKLSDLFKEGKLSAAQYKAAQDSTNLDELKALVKFAEIGPTLVKTKKKSTSHDLDEDNEEDVDFADKVLAGIKAAREGNKEFSLSETVANGLMSLSEEENKALYGESLKQMEKGAYDD